jgi:YHS domain-containing protein
MRIIVTAVAFLVMFAAFSHSLLRAENSMAGPSQSGGAAGQQAQPAKTTVVDPVCGMEIDPAKAAGKSEYKGKTYFFCSDHCKKTFDSNPEAVLDKQPKKK